MKSFLFTLGLLFTFIAISQSQIILQEDFEGGVLPAGWSQTTNATDGGWIVGTPVALSSLYWPIPSNGSVNIIASNDDGCDCDKSRDYLITPALDFTGLSGVSLSFNMFFGKGEYGGYTEKATIEVSTDGINWNVLDDLSEHMGWHQHQVNLSGYAGQSSVFVAFHYDDDGGFIYGWAIDDVKISVPPASDAGLTGLKFLPYGEATVPIPISGTIVNNSLEPITQMEVSYSVNDGTKNYAHFHGIDIQPFQTYEFFHYSPFVPATPGIYDIRVEIETVNNKADDDSTNNVMSFQTEIFPHVVIPNRVDEFLATEPILTTIATAAEGLDKPNDLDFFPILAKNELWVVSERVENSGGSTLTIYDAGTPDQIFLDRTDGNAWHFMSLPTGIAFSNNLNFATSTGVQDANHGGGTFTGPTLWSSDPEIYAQPSGGNGSHLDMLHASPYSMGIESEEENIFWVTDGWNGSVVRYDFRADHGPGNDDHADGIIRRYTEIEFVKDGVVPSHLVLDKSTGWMYVVDNGNDRVVRIDIHSGGVVDTLPLINEPLAEHTEMGNVTWEVIIDSLVRPSGIELIGNRLLVGDYTTGDITVYDVDNDFVELGHIATGEQGLTGIKVGPDGSIWYTNRLLNTLTKAEPGEPTGVDDITWLDQIQVSPNPTSGLLTVEFPDVELDGEIMIELSDLTGKKLMHLQMHGSKQQVDLSGLIPGMYILTVSAGSVSTTRKIIRE